MSIDHLRRYYRLPVRATSTPGDREPKHSAGTVPLEDLLPGDLTVLGDGSSFMTEMTHPGDQRHGHHRFSDLRLVTGKYLALISKDPEMLHFDLRNTVFLDTETTGLGMGTGTRVFLVGVGYFDDNAFKVRQYFLRSYADESSFLAALGEFLTQFSAIVTFNGKAFDWPLLEHRYIFHRQFRKAPLINPLHLDLLHPARRIWKTRLPSCALSSLETNVLGLGRDREDVPGYLIPSLYFAYQRNGDGRPLRGVFYHNLQDVLSLAALTVHIHHVIADPMNGFIDHAIDFYCLGKAFDRAGEPDVAVTCLEEALRRGIAPPLRGECLSALAQLQKRQRWWEGCLRTWELLIDEGGVFALGAYVEIAKYFEHVERDYGLAMDAVAGALRLIDAAGDALAGQELKALEHRLSRLHGRSFRTRERTRTRGFAH